MQVTTALQPGAMRGNYVLLRADTLALLLPQQEVGDAEHLGGDLEPGERPGLMRQTGQEGRRRFAALSDQMGLLAACPPDRFVAASLAGDDGLRWCWNELRVLINVEVQLQPLPTVLLAPDTPVDAYVEHAGEIAFVCSAERLRAYALASRS